MQNADIIYFIESELFEFQLNLQNNYKDLAKEHFDKFAKYVEDARNDGKLSRRQDKKYTKIVDKYTKIYNGIVEEEVKDTEGFIQKLSNIFK